MGTLKLSDYFIFPSLVVFYFSWRMPTPFPLNLDEVKPLLLAFLICAVGSTLSIVLPFRYDYAGGAHLWFGLLKLGKLTLYSYTAILIVEQYYSLNNLQSYLWTLLLIGWTLAVNLLVLNAEASNSITGFSASNATSVLMAMLLVFIVGLLGEHHGERMWRLFAFLSVILIVFSMVYTRGRGGVLSAFFAGGYLLLKLGSRRLVVLTVASILLSLVVAYRTVPIFRNEVYKTIKPDPEYYRKYHTGAFGIDMGSRIWIWWDEGKKFLNNPVLGTGFFHRGGESGLLKSGSHNFFIQMFLETGCAGGLIILYIFGKMWNQAGRVFSKYHGYEVPVKAALIAAATGAMGGEYFYGGMVPFTLFYIYTPVGILPAEHPRMNG